MQEAKRKPGDSPDWEVPHMMPALTSVCIFAIMLYAYEAFAEWAKSARHPKEPKKLLWSDDEEDSE